MGFVHPGGLAYDDYLKFSADADLLIHDAEYTPKEYERYIEWGHSSYTQAVELGLESRVKKLGLFHTNQDRTDQEMDEIVGECDNMISEQNGEMECFSTACDMIFKL